MTDKYDYEKISDFEKTQLPEGYRGNVFNMSYKWVDIIPEPTEPIKIMEIGTYHGANVCSYMKTYAKHSQTEVHCVDPWLDYDGYNEYNGKQATNYSIFINNISKLDPSDLHKIHIHRGLSENVVPLFKDESYDIIYIDGNHEKRYVIEDCVNCFKKIKKGGWMIIDDLQDKEVYEGMSAFIYLYDAYFDARLVRGNQLFLNVKK